MQPTYDQTDPTSPAGSIPHWIDPVRETDLVARRRTVHRTPETGWAEFIATARAAEFFTSLGFKVMVGREFIDPIYVRGRSEAEVSESERLAKAAGVSPVLLQRMGGLTGLCATFDTGHPGKTLAFRVELDALKMNEPVDPDHIPYREGFASERPGLMHACGHDGHQAVAFELGRFIVANRDRLTGRIRFIFQPGEEGSRGAYPIVQSGLLDDVDTLLCAHIATDLQAGTVVAAPEKFLCTTKIDLHFEGVQAHAGMQPQLGRNALLAAAAGWVAGLAKEQIASGLTQARLTGGRLHCSRINGILVVDDTYNANPDSMQAALRTLAELSCAGRRFAVLGRMGELGVFSEEGHVLVGRTAEELRLDCVVSVGTDAARITDAISPNSFTQRLNFSSAEEAAEWLRSHTAPGDIVLFKGSRLARMEQVMNLTFPPQ